MFPAPLISIARPSAPALIFLAAAALTLVLQPDPAAAVPSQLTDAAGCQSAAPSSNGDGSLVAYESTCDPVGQNADANREIFQVDLFGTVTQLSVTANCTNTSPSSNEAGDRVAYESDCNPFGTNPDGNVEIFQYRSSGDVQLTISTGCSSLAPSSNLQGNRVFFDSDCDYTGQNVDGSNEIFRVQDNGNVLQFTDDISLSFCGSFFPSSNGTGRRVAFESDCDLTGDNSEQLLEIFRAADNGPTVRLTFGDDDCASSAPALSSVSLVVALASDCDLTGGNADRSLEIFQVDSAGVVTQLTDDPGDSFCESDDPSVSSDGTVVAYSSFCDPTGGNPDESFEIFVARDGGIEMVTDASTGFSMEPSLDATGTRVAFSSSADPRGTNGDGSSEIFSDRDCSCGSPFTRNVPVLPPTASDALFVLRTAVGQMACELCDCDVNASATITSSDALIVLQAAVGQGVNLDCP